MSALDRLTDRALSELRAFLDRGCRVFAALEHRARLQQRDYPDHEHDAREFAELQALGRRLLRSIGGDA